MNIILKMRINNEFCMDVISKGNDDIKNIYPYGEDLYVALQYMDQYLKLSDIVTLWDLESMLDHYIQVRNHKLLVPNTIENWEKISQS